MPNRVNQLLLAEYKQRFGETDGFIAVGYETMDANTTAAFRATLDEKGIKLKPEHLGATLLAMADLDPLDYGKASPIMGAL